jgi:peptide/nickel transport system permease protein
MPDHRGRQSLWVGGSLLGAIALAAVALPSGLGLDPYAVDLGARLAPPSADHPFGRDALGRDLLARLCAGGRVSLAIATAAVASSLAAGVSLGALAGWRGGWLDALVGRLIDVVLAFPGLLLAIALTVVLGPSLRNVVVALTALGWTGYARLTRTQVATTKHRDFVAAATALGVRDGAVVWRHLLPAALPLLLVQATAGFSGAVLAEASLSFLGLGAAPPTPSWGGMLDEGRLFMLVAPHVLLAPAGALALTVCALHLVGDGLRDRLDAGGA